MTIACTIIEYTPLFIMPLARRNNHRLTPSIFTLFSHQMEDKLDEIAGGRLGRVEYLSEFYLGEEGLKASVDKKTRAIDRFEAKRARLPGLEVDFA